MHDRKGLRALVLRALDLDAILEQLPETALLQRAQARGLATHLGRHLSDCQAGIVARFRATLP